MDTMRNGAVTQPEKTNPNEPAWNAGLMFWGIILIVLIGMILGVAIGQIQS